MSMSKKPVIGVIGAGMMAQVGHLPFLLNNQRCIVKSIAEPRPSIARYLKDSFGFLDVYSDYKDILNDPEIEAIVLSAPRPATGPLTLECLTAGKHLLAEKPMAHSVLQASSLVDAATKSGKLFMVGYMKRYDPGIQEAKRIISMLKGEKILGKLLSATFYNHSKSYAFSPPKHQRPKESRAVRFETWPTSPDWLPASRREGFAWFMNSASHDINLLRYFFPNAEVHSAFVSERGCVSAICQSSDVPLSFDVTNAQTGQWVEGASFIFEDGILRLSVPSPMDTKSVSQVTLQTTKDLPEKAKIQPGLGWSFERQIHGFISCLSGETVPETDGRQGLQDLRLIEEIWKKALGK